MQFYQTLGIYLLISYANLLSSINIFYPQYANYVLFDIGFTYLPTVNPIIPDLILIFYYIYFTIKWFLIHKPLLSKFYIQLSLLFFMRLVAFNITYLPPINDDCVGNINDGFKWITPYVGYACFDNMFSGHTVHMTLLTLFTIHYSENWYEKIIVKLSYIPYLILIVASRLHYSVDVWIGTLLSILLFYVYYEEKIED